MALGKETVWEKCMLWTHVSMHTRTHQFCMPWTSFLDKSAAWTQRFSHTHISQALFWWSTAHGPGCLSSAVGCGKFNSAARWPKNSSCSSRMLDQQMNQCKSESVNVTTLYNTSFETIRKMQRSHERFQPWSSESPVTKHATVGVVFITKMSKMSFPIPEKVFCSFNLLKYSPVCLCSLLVFKKKLTWYQSRLLQMCLTTLLDV